MSAPKDVHEAAGGVVDVHEADTRGHDPTDPRYDRLAWLRLYAPELLPPGWT